MTRTRGQNKIAAILIVTFLIRIVFSYINFYIGYLPQGGADAVRFDVDAYDMMIRSDQIGFTDVMSSGANIHIWLGSLIYSVFGRSPFIWSFILIIFTTWTVYNIHKTVFIITKSYKMANRAGWIACVFPNFALLSSLILRESPIYFFTSMAILYLVKHIVEKKETAVIYFYVFGIIGSIFHSAVFALVFGFLAYSVFFNKKAGIFAKVAVSALGVGFLLFINMTGIGLSKFGGSFEGALDILSEEQQLASHARTNYPQWLTLRGSITDILLLPIRAIAFMFAPLIPFFARSASHIIGIFDAMLYLLIIRSIYLSRNILIKSNAVKAISIIALSVILVFSMGASNFGTNIRHRAKVLPILLTIPLYSKRDRRTYDKFMRRQRILKQVKQSA